uniref:Retrotransposon hot spot (RHS) protein n=1 Tax=Macrostomum lignano TaxID=282301 RepID=A0A1I8JPK3_9PLAT
MCPAANLTPNGFRTVIEIDLIGTFNSIRAAFDAWMAGPRRPAHAGAAKAAIDALTRHLGVEWSCRDRPVRVVAVAPGPVADTLGFDKLGGATCWIDAMWSPSRRWPTDIVVNLLWAGGTAAGPLLMRRRWYWTGAVPGVCILRCGLCGSAAGRRRPVARESDRTGGPASAKCLGNTYGNILARRGSRSRSPLARDTHMRNPQPLVALPSISLSTGTEQVYRVLKCVRIVRPARIARPPGSGPDQLCCASWLGPPTPARPGYWNGDWRARCPRCKRFSSLLWSDFATAANCKSGRYFCGMLDSNCRQLRKMAETFLYLDGLEEAVPMKA